MEERRRELKREKKDLNTELSSINSNTWGRSLKKRMIISLIIIAGAAGLYIPLDNLLGYLAQFSESTLASLVGNFAFVSYLISIGGGLYLTNKTSFYYNENEQKSVDEIEKKMQDIDKELEQIENQMENQRIREKERIDNIEQQRIDKKRKERKERREKIKYFFQGIYNYIKELVTNSQEKKDKEKNKYNRVPEVSRNYPAINILSGETLDEYSARIREILRSEDGYAIYFGILMDEKGKEEGIKDLIGVYHKHNNQELRDIIIGLYQNRYLDIPDIEKILVAFYHRSSVDKEKNREILLDLIYNGLFDIKNFKRVLREISRNGLVDEVDIEDILLEAYENGLINYEDIDNILKSLRGNLNEPVLANRMVNQEVKGRGRR